MARNQVFAELTLSSLAAPLLAVVFLQPTTAFAQRDALVLEEIIVTAQRREQSLMDVPVAIEVFSGDLIRQQGFRNLDELANFSPTVLIETRVQDQDVSIRGVGTTGNTLTHDQAVPFFLDGIHFGRQSQAKLAFLDIESLEVLKGPQPVHFGMNATAGAFNIRSKRPTDTWQGYVQAEISNNNTSDFMFGVGGPINDTWGIRLAGMREATDGYMDYVATGSSIGGYESNGGRIMLTFAPSDNFSMMAKVDAVEIDKDGDANYTCLTGGPIIYGEDGVLSNPGIPPGREASVWNQEIGTPWSVPFRALDTKCFDSNLSVSAGGPWLDPVDGIRCHSCDTGFVDMRRPADAMVRETNGGKGINGYERLDSINTVISAMYSWDNDISLEFTGGTSEYDRDYVIDNRGGPFLTNLQNRKEDFSQWSAELRLRSAGGGKVEWEIGAFMQTTEFAGVSNSLVADVRQSLRFNVITEDVDFSSVFGNVTINFNDQWSLDVGGRYQEADKHNTVIGYAGSWVFDVCPETPCDPLTLTDMQYVDTTGDGVPDGYLGCEGSVPNLDPRGGRSDDYCGIDPSTVRFFGTDAGAGPYYAMPYRETRHVPAPWSWGNAIPVGVTQEGYNVREFGRGEGPWDETFTEEGTSPQITLRYNLGDNVMFYGRYAESFKIGGFDTGQSTIPDLEELAFDTEDAEQIEFGVKGTAGGGRFSYTAAIFETDFPNLQVSVLSTDPNQTSASGNAGQRVQGFEWDTRFAASENWILGFAGAFMDGEMTRFPGAGCTDGEINAAINNASAPCELYDDELRVIPVDANEAFALTAIIDRTGLKAPRTPDWKFIFSADFVMPLSGGRYELTGNMKAFMSDGYILDVEGFEEVVKYDEHGDMNLIIGIRNIDAGWSVNAFARNIFEARPTYHSENDPFPNGTQVQHLGPSSFTSYGIKLEFLFN